MAAKIFKLFVLFSCLFSLSSTFYHTYPSKKMCFSFLLSFASIWIYIKLIRLGSDSIGSNSTLIKQFKIAYDINSTSFPNEFSLKFTEFRINFDLKFSKAFSHLSWSPNIYVIDPKIKIPVQYSLKNEEVLNLYWTLCVCFI